MKYNNSTNNAIEINKDNDTIFDNCLLTIFLLSIIIDENINIMKCETDDAIAAPSKPRYGINNKLIVKLKTAPIRVIRESIFIETLYAIMDPFSLPNESINVPIIKTQKTIVYLTYSCDKNNLTMKSPNIIVIIMIGRSKT